MPVSAIPSVPVSVVPSVPISAIPSLQYVCLFSYLAETFEGPEVIADVDMPPAIDLATPITPLSAIPTVPVSVIPSVPVSAVPFVPISAVPTTSIFTGLGEFLGSFLIFFLASLLLLTYGFSSHTLC